MNTTNDIVLFKEIEEYAKEYKIPIMMKESMDFITSFMKEKNIKTVLEIGTAIGYSALKMASTKANIVTIERDEERYVKAINNVSLSNYKNNIKLIKGDALEINLEGEYDMILIDAAKSQNKKFLNKYKNNLAKNGYILIDNVDFHGLVGNSSEIQSKNLRSMVKKIEEFLSFLDEQTEFKVTKIERGDGLILLERN